MRRIVSVGWLVCWLSLSSASAQTPATPGQRFGFDYKATDLTAYAVTRFELQIDGGAWTDIGIPATANDANTLPEHDTYAAAIPALTPGDHTVSVRACNATDCAVGTSPFAFTLVVIPPSAGNVRIIGGSDPAPDPEPGTGPGGL